MTPKERDVMQQALEALEEMFHSNSTKVAVEKYNTAHNALREALAEQEKPLYRKVLREMLNAHEQAEQEPVAWFVQYKNRHEFVFGSKPEFIVDGVVEPLYAAPVSIAKQSETDSSSSLMRTTVRTKDLTDDEIAKKIPHQPVAINMIDFARAVIAADREKNNV